jgi:hypothetical protein
MKKKHYISPITLTVLLLLVSMLLSSAPKGQAQSVQDWSDPINLSMSGAASNPFMVVDGKGVIHAIWADKFDGYKYSQSADGATWETPVTVKYPFSPAGPPPLLINDAKGVIHIFWLDDKYKLSYAQAAPDNLDTPTSWKAKTSLDTTVYDFDAGVDSQGNVHVVYLKNPTPNPDRTGAPSSPYPNLGTAGAFYKGSSNGGSTWSSGTLLFESPYFRSLSADNAHIRMAVSDKADENRIYAVWDDRAQKRIFMATSADGGAKWGQVKEMVAPQANSGYQTPYNSDIDVLNDKVLATWFVGDGGTHCVPYSWSSVDGGETWGEQTPIIPDSTQCPEKSEFISVDPSYLVDLFTIQGNLSLSVWNGQNWSNPEVQTGPSSVTNPATFEPVSLGCEYVASNAKHLLVTGCDQGAGGDVWYMERQLDSFDYLFPLPTQWSGDTNIVSAPRNLSFLSSVADAAGNVHAVWLQSPSSPTDAFAPVIQYAHWNGKEWSAPSPIFANLDGAPTGLSLQIDSQQRLLLSWINSATGELMFSWANSERANLPVEWAQPITLSSSSTLTDSPDILVDATDRIMIAYAVTLNEGRGIYLIQSTDLGKTWSQPVKVFDAVAEGWEMVNQPKLAVTQDGTLHLLFTKYALLGNAQPEGLYYSQSADGGVTWTPAEAVSDQPVQWSELVAYQGTLHRLWQEQNKLAATTNHQVSADGGKTWEAAYKLPSNADLNAKPSVSVDGTGNLHFVQVSGKDSQVFEEWVWSQGHWQLSESRKVGRLELNAPPIAESGVTSNGEMYALLQFEKLVKDGSESDILSIDRSLDKADYAPPVVASISIPSSSSVALATPELQVTPTVESPFATPTNSRPFLSRNLIGLILVIIIALALVIIMVPRKSKASDKTKKSQS